MVVGAAVAVVGSGTTVIVVPPPPDVHEASMNAISTGPTNSPPVNIPFLITGIVSPCSNGWPGAKVLSVLVARRPVAPHGHPPTRSGGLLPPNRSKDSAREDLCSLFADPPLGHAGDIAKEF